MPNAVFVPHSVLFIPHCRPPPALMCRRRSTPSSSLAITVCGSRRKPLQSSSPIHCLCRGLSLLSLVDVVSRRRPPSFQFIVRRRRRRRRRRFLSVVDIINIYCPPSPHLLSPAPSLVSCRATSPPPSPATSTLTSGEIGQRWMGGGVRLTAQRNQWTAVVVAAMCVDGRQDGRQRRWWHDPGGRRQRQRRRNERRDGGAITMRRIEIVVDGGGGSDGRRWHNGQQDGRGSAAGQGDG